MQNIRESVLVVDTHDYKMRALYNMHIPTVLVSFSASKGKSISVSGMHTLSMLLDEVQEGIEYVEQPKEKVNGKHYMKRNEFNWFRDFEKRKGKKK